MADRLVRGCAACGQEDDHPRHTIQIVNPLGDAVLIDRHMDCCAALGCPICTQVLAGAPEEKTHGHALVEHLTSGLEPVDHNEGKESA